MFNQGNAQNLTNKIDQMLAGDREKSILRLRMYLILICYYKFYNERKDCPLIQQLLNDNTFTQKLNITNDELLFFR